MSSAHSSHKTFLSGWNCCFKREEEPANEQCWKADVDPSGNKAAWMLVDLARPPVTTVTNLQDSEQCTLLPFPCAYNKASPTCQRFYFQLMFHTLLLNIVPNKAHPPTNPQDFTLAFVNASSSCTDECINAQPQLHSAPSRDGTRTTQLPSADGFLKCI